jgi:6-phosphogluconolactonase (cycloisomerase 2 family)
MSTRFTWVFGIVILVSLGLLAACGSHYSASNDGLVIVPSQGSAVVQSFSFSLNNGHVSTINTGPTVSSVPNAVVIDPAGTYAYVASAASSAVSGSSNEISSFKINSDGTLSAAGTAPVIGSPVAIAIDSAGKYLFVANGLSSTVSVFSVGSGGSLSGAGTFPVPVVQGGGAANLVALAPTPTTFPVQYAPCSLTTAPSSEFLYVADAQNNVVWEFSVDTSSGALAVPAVSFLTGSIPSGVAVDPCNRFVYVGNQLSNSVSAYKICNIVSLPSCPLADGSLVPVSHSPFSAGTGPGPMVVSPYGDSLYVLDKGSTAAAGEISAYSIGQTDGELTPLTAATVATGNTPVAIAIRSDDSWLFVTNNGSSSGNGSVSQYSITPATGVLTPSGSGVLTDTFPWGVAVK